MTTVADFTSEATVVSGAAVKDIPEGARAVVRSRPVTAFRFRIFFAGANPLVVAVREAALSTIPGAVQSPRAAADAVVRFGEGKIYTERPNGFVMSPAVPAEEPGAVAHVVRQMKEWSRWQQLLAAKGSDPMVQLKVTDATGGSPREVADGATITIAVCNTGTRAYFTRVVYFSSAGSVTPLDLATDGAPLAAGQCRAGGSFQITVDEGRKRGVEFFKAFATADKIDLEPFTEPAIRGDQPDPALWSSVTKSLTVVKH